MRSISALLHHIGGESRFDVRLERPDSRAADRVVHRVLDAIARVAFAELGERHRRCFDAIHAGNHRGKHDRQFAMFPLFGFAFDGYDARFAEKLGLLLNSRKHEHVTWSGTFRAGHPPERLRVGVHALGYLASTTERAVADFHPDHARRIRRAARPARRIARGKRG